MFVGKERFWHPYLKLSVTLKSTREIAYLIVRSETTKSLCREILLRNQGRFTIVINYKKWLINSWFRPLELAITGGIGMPFGILKGEKCTRFDRDWVALRGKFPCMGEALGEKRSEEKKREEKRRVGLKHKKRPEALSVGTWCAFYRLTVNRVAFQTTYGEYRG